LIGVNILKRDFNQSRRFIICSAFCEWVHNVLNEDDVKSRQQI